MFKRLLLLLPALAGAALLATRLVPGPLRDGTTQLASGWRIRPAGRQVTVGTLPLNLLTLSDGSVLVTNNGYGENGLMRIDPVSARVVWRTRLPAAWLGLARAGGGWRDTRSEEHTSELQSHSDLVCRLLLEKKKKTRKI